MVTEKKHFIENNSKGKYEKYTDAWEQRKLGELAEIGDIDHRMPNSVEDGIPYLMTGDFIGENELNFKGVKNISEEDYSILSQKIKPERGDILFARYASVGAVRYVDFTRKFLISYSCAIIKQSPKINSCYLYYYLTSEGAQTQIKLETKTGSQSNIGIDSMKKYINIPIPKQDEQKKIGDFYSSLDTLITLHQRKCMIFRKSVMFAWEQRKVTDLGEVYIGLVTTMTAHYTNEGALLIRNSDIKDGKFEFDTEPIYLDKEFAEQNKSRMHKVGDVITVHTGDVGTSAVITENEANSIGFATIVTRPNQKLLDSYYLSAFLNTEKHKAWAVQMSTGDGRTNYNLRDYTELVVSIPKLEEQKKIASYVSNLNNLITLHQHE